jgi:hypothetical protein
VNFLLLSISMILEVALSLVGWLIHMRCIHHQIGSCRRHAAVDTMGWSG